MSHMIAAGAAASTGTFTPGPGAADRRARTSPGCSTPGTTRYGLAGPAGPRAARLPRRRRQDGPHLPGHRRRALLGARRPGPPDAPTASSSCSAATRSPSTPAARRSSPRRSSRPSPTTPTSTTSSSPGRPSRALGPGGRRDRAAARRRRPSTDDDLLAEAAQAHRPLQAPEGVPLRRRRSCAPPPARPTTAGPRSRPSTTRSFSSPDRRNCMGTNERSKITMTDDEIATFLDQSRTATMASTARPAFPTSWPCGTADRRQDLLRDQDQVAEGPEPPAGQHHRLHGRGRRQLRPAPRCVHRGHRHDHRGRRRRVLGGGVNVYERYNGPYAEDQRSSTS